MKGVPPHLSLNCHHHHYTHMARTKQSAHLSTDGSARRVLLKWQHATPLANSSGQDVKVPDLQVCAHHYMSICHTKTVIFYSIVLCVKMAIYGNVTMRIIAAPYVQNALKFYLCN